LRPFTRAALRSEEDQVRKEPLPPLEWQQFKRLDPGAEVIILFGRGSKQHFRDTAHFWLTVLHYWFRDSPLSDTEAFFAEFLDDEHTVCKEISCEEFRRIVQWYDFVETPHNFSPHEQVCQAWLVYDIGINIVTLAETSEEFVVFSWELHD
jgi:hypothetical protein